MTRKSFNLEIKAVQEDGFFRYGAVFGNIDWYNDVILPGAFTASIAKWRAKNKMPPVLWNHNDSEPIGVYTNIYEDEKGLYVEGKLLIDDVPRAKSTHALLKAGAIDGLSIGYSTKRLINRQMAFANWLKLTLAKSRLSLSLQMSAASSLPLSPN